MTVLVEDSSLGRLAQAQPAHEQPWECIYELKGGYGSIPIYALPHTGPGLLSPELAWAGLA